MSRFATIERTILRTEPQEEVEVTDWILLGLIVAIGALIRFMSLGEVGFHGDEKTTIFPALAVLEQGAPYFPSGMFYGRALAHTYLIAASVWMFGESEWAVRLPSALVGSLMPLLAFFLGRRFLSAKVSLVFVAVIAFLPGVIELSQTARMYIFWLAALMLFGIAIFRWEITQSWGSLILAFSLWILALHFQRLSILAAPLFLFPGLMNRSTKDLFRGAMAIGLCAVAFTIYRDFIGSFYPESSEKPARDAAATAFAEPSPLYLVWGQYPSVIVLGVLFGLLLLAWSGRDLVRRNSTSALAKLLFSIGLIACACLQYYVSITALIFASIIWLRFSVSRRLLPLTIWLIVGVIAALQASILAIRAGYFGRELIGAFVGEPSIWPILRLGEYSPVALAMYLVVLVVFIYKLVDRSKIPDHGLFFVLAVWAPLVVIGTETSYPELRYMSGVLPFFLLCCIAGVDYVVRQLDVSGRIGAWSRKTKFVGATALILLVVNPTEVAQVAGNDYTRHPDHKGAAEFVQSLPYIEGDIVIAEDVLQQTYYLGSVDYWLRNFTDARTFLVVNEGQKVDMYTHTPALTSGEDLLRVLEQNKEKRIIIIGSGEIQPGKDEWARGRGIAQVLQSPQIKPAYIGRDGVTTVWIVGG